jgi:DNA polymerase III subunit delta'
MTNYKYDNPKNSLVLYEIDEYLDFLSSLYLKKKFPKVLMLSGNKGIGKSTLINHFLNFVYDKDNYDLENRTISEKSNFNQQYKNDSFGNIIYLSGDSFKNIKVDDIRNLKSNLFKSTLLKKERFVIFDDVEIFNTNSLNALLKIIEEPTKNNYFILINNKTKPLIDTIYSRSLDLKIILTDKKRIQIIENLIKNNNLEVKVDYNLINLSPGSFLSHNNIINQNDISFEDHLIENIKKILNLYKKKKNFNFINLILFMTDLYFLKLKEKKTYNIDKIIEDKSFIIDNINKFAIYNLNQNSVLNAINNKLYNE